MLPPLPRCSGWASSSLVSPNRVSLPRFHVRVGLHIVLFEVCSAFTRVAACTLARSPYVVTAIRRLQTLRLLHDCSDCFRLERIAGWGLHPLESAALSRRTPRADIGGQTPARLEKLEMCYKSNQRALMESSMGVSFPNESPEYRAARNKLLEREAALRREMEAVAAEIRSLPPGGPASEDYEFDHIDATGAPAKV